MAVQEVLPASFDFSLEAILGFDTQTIYTVSFVFSTAILICAGK